ncbi:MAG: MBL fold metallo-hydrolase, partial [Pirellulales bacterium]|nr:MBL fold metallo-hydrolase [Pirellulales bacterium]
MSLFVTERLTDKLFVICDSDDGNTSIHVENDGLLVVDTKSAALTDDLLAEIAQIADKPVRFVVNTHWHPDHVGGNERLAKAGATIIAHEVARKRMSEEQYIRFADRRIPALPEVALPRITMTDGLKLHYNRETIVVSCPRFTHTDGDAIVFFQQANVIQLGDIYFNGVYPYVSVSSGASYAQMLNVGRELLSAIDDQTWIIPGHGPMARKAEYARYLNMLDTVYGRVARQIAEGKSEEEVIAVKPTREFDPAWAKGNLSPDLFVHVVYDDIVT